MSITKYIKSIISWIPIRDATQTIERIWGALKWRNKRKRERRTKCDFLETYLAEFIARKCMMGDNPLQWILKHLGIFYDPKIAATINVDNENGNTDEEHEDVIVLDLEE